MKIGFIGLGAMGAPHGGEPRARQGTRCSRFDLNGEGQPQVERAKRARAPKSLFTSLPGPGRGRSASPETSRCCQVQAWFDLPTNSPEAVRRSTRAVGKIHFLDAPVSGGPSGAEVRQASDLGRWRPARFSTSTCTVLKAIGDQPLYVGPIGAGTVAKLAHNAASFTDPGGARRDLHPRREGRRRAARALPGAAPGRHRAASAPSIACRSISSTGKYDPAAFTARPRAQGRDARASSSRARVGVPMRIGQIALDELAEGDEARLGRARLPCDDVTQERRAGVMARSTRRGAAQGAGGMRPCRCAWLVSFWLWTCSASRRRERATPSASSLTFAPSGEVDGTPEALPASNGAARPAGSFSAAPGERSFHDALVSLAGADQAVDGTTPGCPASTPQTTSGSASLTQSASRGRATCCARSPSSLTLASDR